MNVYSISKAATVLDVIEAETILEAEKMARAKGFTGTISISKEGGQRSRGKAGRKGKVRT